MTMRLCECGWFSGGYSAIDHNCTMPDNYQNRTFYRYYSLSANKKQVAWGNRVSKNIPEELRATARKASRELNCLLRYE